MNIDPKWSKAGPDYYAPGDEILQSHIIDTRAVVRVSRRKKENGEYSYNLFIDWTVGGVERSVIARCTEVEFHEQQPR